MASGAIRCGGNMVGRLRDRSHPRKCRTIVAGRAARADASMVHRRGGTEGRCAFVAGRAIERCWNVVRRLAGDPAGAGVACRAAGSDPCMIEGRAEKADHACVAGRAVGRGRNVIGRLGYGCDARERCSVMARRTSRRDARMIHRRPWAERHRADVTRRTIERGRNVVRCLPSRR